MILAISVTNPQIEQKDTSHCEITAEKIFPIKTEPGNYSYAVKELPILYEIYKDQTDNLTVLFIGVRKNSKFWYILGFYGSSVIKRDISKYEYIVYSKSNLSSCLYYLEYEIPLPHDKFAPIFHPGKLTAGRSEYWVLSETLEEDRLQGRNLYSALNEQYLAKQDKISNPQMEKQIDMFFQNFKTCLNINEEKQ